MICPYINIITTTTKVDGISTSVQEPIKCKGYDCPFYNAAHTYKSGRGCLKAEGEIESIFRR